MQPNAARMSKEAFELALLVEEQALVAGPLGVNTHCKIYMRVICQIELHLSPGVGITKIGHHILEIAQPGANQVQSL